MTAELSTDLGRFFRPSAVALVGATEDASRFGGRCFNRLLDFGFPGAVYPVNPRFRELRGLPCYRGVRDLPTVPDHVGIMVPAERVMGVLEDCAARGVRFATVFSGGFAETATPEGRALQSALADFARRSGVRVMGPNCNGLVNFVDGLAMTSSGSVVGPRRPAGDIGIVSQSGGLGQVNVMWRAQEAGLGVSYEVSCGNSADLNAFDFAGFLVDDPHTCVILMVMEHFGDGARFMALAQRAARREKPVVMLKLGRTDAGVRAVASHSGALTGSFDVYDAALRQFGVIRVDDCNELYQTAMLLRGRRWPRGTRAAAATISGGNGALIVDLGASLGMQWPEYGPETKSRLAGCLPRHATTTNPTDVTPVAIGRKGIYRRCIEAIADDDGIDVVVPILTLAAADDVREVAQAAREASKAVALLWTGGCLDDRGLTDRDVIADGVPVYRDTLSCVKAVRAAMSYGEFLAHSRRRGAIAPERPPGTDPALVRRLLREAPGALSESISKRVLAAYGFPRPVEALARSANEAVGRWRERGAAVALKIDSPDIPHKTEAGAIRLGLNNEGAVRLAYDEVINAAARHCPAARLNGVTVQPMAPAGVEWFIGTVVDPVFGPLVVTGLGGVYVELLRDVASRVAPIDALEARRMLRELRSARLLDGVRGAAACDTDLLCDLVSRASWLAHDLCDEIAGVDVNPLVLAHGAGGAVVVDALVVRRECGCTQPAPRLGAA